MVPSDRKLREFLIAQSPVWLTDRLLDASASDPALLAALRAAVAVRAREIHTRACAEGNPDPAALAQRLFTLAIADDWGIFTDVVATYADAVGPTGVATLRGLIGDELARVSRRTAGAHRPPQLHDPQAGGAAARLDGVDAVVDVLARDLTSAHRFEVICQELVADAGRVDDALGWARRGLTELDEHVR